MDGSKSELGTREYTLGGLAAVTTCNIGWGFTDICIAIIGRGQVSTWIHGFTGAAFLILISIIFRYKLVWKDFLNAFPIGLQRSVVWTAMFVAFQEANPSIAITIMSFALVISIVVFGPKLGEPVTKEVLFVSFIGFIGLVLTSVESFEDFHLSKGAILAFLVLPVSAAGTYILRNVQKKVPPRTSATYMYIWIGLLTSISIPFINPRFEFTNQEIMVIFLMMIVGAGGHVLFNYSQPRTSFRFNNIASTIHNPATAIFAWWLIGSTLQVHQIVGITIVTLVVGYVAIITKKKDVQELEENLSPGV